MKKTIYVGFDFVKLDPRSVRVDVSSDASFVNGSGIEIQWVFIILRVDRLGKENIAHYGSSRCHHVTCSVVAAVVHALVHAFAQRCVFLETLEKLLGRRIEIEYFEDSFILSSSIASNSTTAERRLQIDFCALRESYRKGKQNKVGWIPGKQNSMDVLTKEILSQNTAEWNLMTAKSMNVRPIGRASKQHTPGMVRLGCLQVPRGGVRANV